MGSSVGRSREDTQEGSESGHNQRRLDVRSSLSRQSHQGKQGWEGTAGSMIAKAARGVFG